MKTLITILQLFPQNEVFESFEQTEIASASGTHSWWSTKD